MIRALALTLGDLADRRVAAVLVRSLLVTLLVFAVMGVALGWLLRGADPCGWAGFGGCPLDGASSGLGAVVLTGLGLWFLFPAVALGVVAAFTDDVIGAVEARHYPAAAASARRLGLAGGAWLGVVGSLRVLVYNIVALPLYLVLLVTGVGPAILFAIVNGLALAADLGTMVAARHGDQAGRRRWLRESRGGRWSVGVPVSALFLVPVANLLAPILGAAAMTHLYHRRTKGGSPA